MSSETQHNLERHQAEMATLGGVFPPPPPPPAMSGNLIRDPVHERQGLLSSPGRYNANLHQHHPLMYGTFGGQPVMPYTAGISNPHFMPSFLQVQQAMMAQHQAASQPAGTVATPGSKHPKEFFNVCFNLFPV